MSLPSRKEFFTRKEVADRWGCTPRTVDRRRRAGVLPWVDLAGGRGARPMVRFKIEDIKEYETATPRRSRV